MRFPDRQATNWGDGSYADTGERASRVHHSIGHCRHTQSLYMRLFAGQASSFGRRGLPPCRTNEIGCGSLAWPHAASAVTSYSDGTWVLIDESRCIIGALSASHQNEHLIL